MNEQSSGIVVGYDGSPGARLALDWAAETARRDDKRLTIVHCVGLTMTPTFRAYEPGLDASMYEELARGVLADASRRAVEGGSEPLDVHTVSVIGSPAAELVAASENADLVVMGSRGHGVFATGLLGSTAYAVTAHAHCPAVVVRGEGVVHPGPEHPVVVGYDESKAAEAALDAATWTAVAAGAPLHVVSVDNAGGLDAWPEADDLVGRAELADAVHRHVAEALDRAVADARAQHPGLTVQRVLAGGAVGSAIAAHATECHAGLVVLGSRGHGGFAGLLLGSVGHRVIHDAPCPVMVVR